MIKLSQYSTRPALQHFKAVQGIFNYLKDTQYDGIYYWRNTPRTVCSPSSNYIPQDRDQNMPYNIRVMVDSDHANDTSH